MEETEETNNHDISAKRYKRKRKKTFLKNARKYAKKGWYGRGSQLDAETYQYFVRILEVYREGFENDDDKKIFVNNVFQQTENEEVKCSCNQVGCRVVEMLLPFANDSVVERYMNAFSEELRPLCADRFASHVLEALLGECCKRSLDKDTKDDVREKFKGYTLKISKFLLNNLEDYVWDVYGNHIIRSVFRNLAQLPNVDRKEVKNKSKEVTAELIEIPNDYAEVLQDYGERLLAWPQFKELPYSELTSAMLQILLRALSKCNTKILKKYIKKILDECFCTDSDPNNSFTRCQKLFKSTAATMLVETMMEIASPKHYTQIYAKCFKGHVCDLARTKSTSFSVQKLLTYCKEKVEFEEMFEELKGFDPIISAGNSGVILALAEGCKRFATKQGLFIQNISSGFHCESEDKQTDLLICLCKFVNYGLLQELNIQNYEKEKFNLHGTLIVQHILEFNKPIKFVNAILGMDTADLKGLFSNTMGSHLVDSYMTSKFIGEKSREKLIRKLQGTYQDLASTKYGSRSFEAIWNACNMKFKINIMDELVYKDAAWSNTEHGKIIASKINLVLYKRNKEEWKSSLNNVNKLKELTDLLQ
ncbi:nucleolar protein 9 [Holotrichia oblita]|uniref:Nucleolar protein 9 n=1 Tax=Holotrichia oblita TaxID=644536 RepID=A0ACB9TJW0_HOLOL|nr:nucleolar protein 9 [Holotrichia oblita]